MGSSTAYWYVQDRVVYVHNVGDLTADNFREVDTQIIAFMRDTAENGSSRKVHVFVDSTEMGKLPRFSELEGGRILKYMKEPNCGWTIVVGHRNNPLLPILSRLLTTVMGVNLYMAETMEKGARLLNRMESDIVEMPDIDVWKRENVGPASTKG
jgi:hypothetical protein